MSANTAYTFESTFLLSKTAGVTSHTISLGFGGTATVNSILEEYHGHFNTTQTTVNGTVTEAIIQTTTNTVVTQAAASATIYFYGVIKGTVSVNAGGTFIPQYTLSAAPGGAYSTQAGSYFLIYPVGASGANTNVGTWA